MTVTEIVGALTERLHAQGLDPNEKIYSISMQDVMSAIARRKGEQALALPLEHVLLARDEVRVAIEHLWDERDILDSGLDQWEIVRNL